MITAEPAGAVRAAVVRPVAGPAAVRPVARPAAAVMVTLAAAALADLAWAFTPLAAVWAAHEAATHGGQLPGVVLVASHLAVLVAVAVTHVAAWALLAGWLQRAVANLRVLGLAQRSVATAWFVPALAVSAVARDSRCRRCGALVWSWWLAWLAGLVAMLAGTALTWPSELNTTLAEVLHGTTVDVGRAGELLGYQIAGRLPGAVLLLAAAVLGMVTVERVTAAQYDRFDEVR